MTYFSHAKTPLGPVTLASDGDALIGLWFDGQKHFGSTLEGQGLVLEDLPVFAETRRWLELYFSGKDPGFTPPLSFHGTWATKFRKQVWRELLKIPYGRTVSYGELARRIQALPEYAKEGRRVSARAVGGAVGRNPISLIVPCHRVIGVDGSLTGYAGGVERKQWLLETEQNAGQHRSRHRKR